MDICLITDSGYVMPTGVLMTSIILNNTGPVCFHLILKDVTVEDRRMLSFSGGLRKNVKILFYDAPSHVDSICPVHQAGQSQHISISAYYRLFLADILPDNLERVIYLDCDIICLKPFDELWGIDLKSFPVAAVKDISSTMDIYDRLCYPSEDGYFNSGVLLINLVYWRQHSMAEKFVQFISDNSDSLKCHDQDVLNRMFHGNILEIPKKYNLQDYFLSKWNEYYPCSEEDFRDSLINPTFIHYCTYMKPWYKGCPHPYVDKFLYYLKLSPWKSRILRPYPAKSIKEKISNLLVLLSIKKYTGSYLDLKQLS